MPIEVGYWSLRGLVGFIRLIDAYTEEGIKWKTYEVAKYEEWKKEKAENEKKFDFPNLPWMIDGDVKITQSLAILKYIAKKHGLTHDGTLKGEANADMVEVITLSLIVFHSLK